MSIRMHLYGLPVPWVDSRAGAWHALLRRRFLAHEKHGRARQRCKGGKLKPSRRLELRDMPF